MKDDTIMVHVSRDPSRHYGIVNLPVYHASTVLYPTIKAFNNRIKNKYRGVRYGASGTPTTFALADAVATLEGGAGAVVVSSGLAACTMALTAFLKQGDHILVTDSVYGPTRKFCDAVLKRFGVEITYYDPLIGGNISELIRENTRVVFTESPGSLTFEVQDIPAIAEAAHNSDVLVLMDNTWATPLFFKPFEHGVDISIQAGTKYIAGHSDLVIGIITARTEALFRKIKDTTLAYGDIAGPEDCFLALRGLRSMGARLRCQQEAGLRIAAWLKQRPEVKRVMHPALPDDPGHALWKRDFTGACSLFGVVFHTSSEKAISHMVDGYRFFKIGASWGGFESLVIPAELQKIRTAVPWTETGYVLRYHVGLEDPEDLIEDLKLGFDRLNQAHKQKA
ncbi:MAG: cystathionine beta-lyase [Deltaproteobacteria bacterium]|nr:cystathionine beta-lyase [Deltaproteobacteria bacterium]MBW1960117.1 cystathionine beta-lyase [Deltaproteobacteria bacterium]MBW1994080.1 cystathionine beta-lyase [Deltaproteobacteria bacterium]MBW2153495.1 cystathionine beta-lyase [Deltaproteobacteria bacterium]